MINEHDVHPVEFGFECSFCEDFVKQYPAKSKIFYEDKICAECAKYETLEILADRMSGRPQLIKSRPHRVVSDVNKK
jgi:hypothetical protein